MKFKASAVFAGLYEFWPGPTKEEVAEDRWVVTATILARAAHDVLGHILDRTPAIILKDLQDQWLDPTMTERDQEQRLIGKELGSVCNNGRQLIEAAR